MYLCAEESTLCCRLWCSMCFLPSLKSASSLAFWCVSCTIYCVFSTAAFSTLVYDIFTPILCEVGPEWFVFFLVHVHTDVQVWAVVCSGDYRDSVSVCCLHSRSHPMEVRRDSMLYISFTLYSTALYVRWKDFNGENPPVEYVTAGSTIPYPKKLSLKGA